MTAALAVDGLVKRFGPTLAVNGLSFEVEAGSITGFLGPNGAGKTTTLRCLLGLVRPDAGTALVQGRPYRELTDPIRRVGVVLETSGFHPGRTARQTLVGHCLAAGLATSRADETLALVGLTGAAKRAVKTFSTGMRQRLGLAMALLGEPDILVLDEPANGLDPDGMRWLRDFLREQSAAGTAVLVSSHVLAEVAQTVDDVVIISKGILRARGPVGELTGAGRENKIRVRTNQGPALRTVLKAEGIAARLGRDGILSVTGTTPEAIGRLAVANAIPIFEIASDGPSLEDRFLELTGEEVGA